MLKPVAKRNDGFTLVELVIAITITAIISLVILRVFTTASESLLRSADEAAAATQAARFSRLMKYDFSGSQDAYIFGPDFPVDPVGSLTSSTGDPSYLCSTATASTWPLPDEESQAFTRGLVTLQITEVPGYSQGSEQQPAGFAEPTVSFVGYEVRRNPDTLKFELWRVTCGTAASGRPTAWTASTGTEERLIELGDTIATNTDGLSNLQCFNLGGGLVKPNPGWSTTSKNVFGAGRKTPIFQRCASYRFRLPYSGNRNALRQLAGSVELGSATDLALGRLTSRVERLD